jgi:hypothetical protein
MAEHRTYVPPSISGPFQITVDTFRTAAADLLLVISQSRGLGDHDAYQGHWDRLWKLIRTARAAGVDFKPRGQGHWGIVSREPIGKAAELGIITLSLTAGDVDLPIRLPPDVDDQDLQNATELSNILNGAGVVPPW